MDQGTPILLCCWIAANAASIPRNLGRLPRVTALRYWYNVSRLRDSHNYVLKPHGLLAYTPLVMRHLEYPDEN
jgi:hypothetical protein